VANHGEIIREIRRLLRAGGHAIVSFRNFHHPLLWDPIVTSKRLVRSLLRRSTHAGFEPGGFLDHRQIEREMAEHGVVYRDFTGIGFGSVRLDYQEVSSEKNSIRSSRALTAVSSGWVGAGRSSGWRTSVSESTRDVKASHEGSLLASLRGDSWWQDEGRVRVGASLPDSNDVQDELCKHPKTGSARSVFRGPPPC